MALLSQAGGLGYHLRALKYKPRWKPFCQAIEAWLNTWNPPEKKIILFGPSAGYTLPSTFLGRFEKIGAVEPDPVARYLFKKRFKNHEIEWFQKSPLFPKNGIFNHDELKTFIDSHEDYCFLFCNLLGQLHLLFPNEVRSRRFSEFKASLPYLFLNHSWASYHDRLSGIIKPSSNLQKSTQSLPNSQLVSLAYSAKHLNVPVELIDHEMEGFAPALSRIYFRWELTPRHHHLIEGVFESRTD